MPAADGRDQAGRKYPEVRQQGLACRHDYPVDRDRRVDPERREHPRRRDDQAAALYRRNSRLRVRTAERSEEHTSELQSLMRISYAVFCLKKKTLTNTTKH